MRNRTQAEAKRFFVDRVLAEARDEGLHLSKAEKYILRWSESDPDFEPEPELDAILKAEISDKEYEAKISGLIRRRYDLDVASDASSVSHYREAYASLSQGDHYLLIMIDDALGFRVKGGAFQVVLAAGRIALFTLGVSAVLLLLRPSFRERPLSAAVFVISLNALVFFTYLLFGLLGYRIKSDDLDAPRIAVWAFLFSVAALILAIFLWLEAHNKIAWHGKR